MINMWEALSSFSKYKHNQLLSRGTPFMNNILTEKVQASKHFMNTVKLRKANVLKMNYASRQK